MKLDDLHRFLSDPFVDEPSITEVEDACRKAARIICLVDDWATAKGAFMSAFGNGSTWSKESKLYGNAITALYDAAKGE